MSDRYEADNYFVIIPTWVLESDISAGALRLFAVLQGHANRTTGICWPSKATLAEECKISTKSRKSIESWTKELVQIGALEVRPRTDPNNRQTSNTYKVLTAVPVHRRGAQNCTPPPSTEGPPRVSTEAVPASAGTRLELEEVELEPEEQEKPSSHSATVVEVFDAWKQANNKTAGTKLDAKRERLIKKALADYPLDDVLDAVRGIGLSPFHQGDNQQGTKYNGLDVCLRNAEKIEHFRDLARAGGEKRRRSPRDVSDFSGQESKSMSAEEAFAEGW